MDKSESVWVEFGRVNNNIEMINNDSYHNR